MMNKGKWKGAVCCICGGEFSSSYEGKPYCNKHWQRMYHHGTPDLIGRKRTNHYVLNGDSLTITTANGTDILADANDYDILSKYSWCISKTGYAVAYIDGKSVKMHRYLIGVYDKMIIIDHKNGNVLDNRRCNLRLCTQKENSRNTKTSKNNNVGILGVSKKKNGKYRARIMVDRKEIALGTFYSLEEAKIARMKAEIKYFGNFAPCLRNEVTDE